MIFPIKSGKLLLSGGLVSCQCCATGSPPPPTPGIDILMATATSAGGNLGCAMGPVIKNFDVSPPYTLAPGSYQLRVDFTTADALFHFGCYYQLELSFSPPTATIDWSTSATGTVTDPWAISSAGRIVRYNVEDSGGGPPGSWGNCGGTNDQIQTGTALATITVTESTSMGFDFTGIAELQDTGFENISFYLRSLP